MNHSNRLAFRNHLSRALSVLFGTAIISSLLMASLFAADPPQALVDAAKKEGKLVYWGTDAETAPKIVKSFEAKYPFMKGNIEFWDANSNEVVERVVTEAKAGRFSPDFISMSEDWYNRLKEAGLLMKHDWTNVRAWQTDVQPADGLWANVAIDPRPAYYNTEVLKETDAPKSLEGLINAKYKGMSALSSASEEFPFIYAYFWRQGNKLAWDKSFDFFTRLVKTTKPQIVDGYTGPTRLLAAGEFGLFHIGLFSRAYQMLNKGAPLALVPLDPMYGSVRAFGILKNAPHPNAAKLYAHWITTQQGSVTYANLLGKFPYDPSAANAKPVKVAKKNGITRSMLHRIPTEAWTKADTEKSANFYYKLIKFK
jgi:iron(III) transport system substrate-binding protein